MSARHPDAEIRFVGTVRGIENRIIPEEGYALELMPVVPFSRSISWSWVRFPIALLKSIIKTARLIRSMRADIVVATGGYVAGPAVIAGRLCRKPIVLNEQNSFPGSTTRIASLFATKIFLGLPGAKAHLWRKSRAELTGNPVEIPIEMPEIEVVRAKLGLDSKKLTILATGGSQGAASINRALVELIERGDFSSDAQLLWQTGQEKFQETVDLLGEIPSNIVLKPFIRPMWEAYRSADIVIARCGALTLSEISIFGLPAILVPYPYAAADHQKLNALSFAKAGAASVLSDTEINGASLANALNEIIKDNRKREKMAQASKELGRPSALKEIVRNIEKILEEE